MESWCNDKRKKEIDLIWGLHDELEGENLGLTFLIAKNQIFLFSDNQQQQQQQQQLINLTCWCG
jgi:hypothetical protein